MKRVFRTAKRVARSLMRQDFFISPDYKCANERFGSHYGGWDVVGEPLGKNSVVYSFGVGEDASFDIALIERFGMDVYAFDPTPKSIAWARSQNLPSQFTLYEYGIADFDGNISFNPPENPAHISYTILDRPKTEDNKISAPVKRLATIMRELGHNHIDLLKMDIEGAEYVVIDDLDKVGIRPKQLLVEFHHRFPGVGVQKSRDAITKLKAMGYGLFSVSVTGEEYGFFYRYA
jgi:FkbM family methyltransferase